MSQAYYSDRVQSKSPESGTVCLVAENTRTIVWRYSGKNALDEPAVRAVQEFQKAMTQSEEARKQNKQ